MMFILLNVICGFASTSKGQLKGILPSFHFSRRGRCADYSRQCVIAETLTYSRMVLTIPPAGTF